jgi:hypothetical protein
VIRRAAAGCGAGALLVVLALALLLGTGSRGAETVENLASPTIPEPTPTVPCSFQLGFAEFHSAAPELVGECVTAEQPEPATGNSTQHTTKGLLVWRRADGLIAFTDGHRSWVRGPDGAIRARLNDERFAYEAAPAGSQLRVVPAGPPIGAGAPPTAAESAATPAPTTAAGGIRDGTHLVGSDIQPGTYRSNNVGAGCYWARLSGLGGTVDEIIANENATGPAIVTVAASDRAFSSVGCAPWLAVAEGGRGAPATPFGSGTFAVGADVAPGTWRADGGTNCYWARLRSFAGGVEAIVANESRDGPVVAEIGNGDVGFTSVGCGSWTRVQ